MKKPKRKRDWSKVKGYRDKGEYMPIFPVDTNTIQIVHNRCKFEFWTDAPLEQKLKWENVHGCRLDNRLPPPLPQGFEQMRPLRQPDKKTPNEAKKRAFAILCSQRAEALAKKIQPLLFKELPTQYKSPRNV